MIQPGRKYSAGNSYRYGFNNQEKSFELNEDGNNYTAEFWQYDARVGRRWNADPKPIVSISPYAGFNNNPILFTDFLGDTSVVGAGGTTCVNVDEKYNQLEYYQPNNTYTASGKSVPVQPGQLRSVSNVLGTFRARWRLNAQGQNEFAGYLNDKDQTIEQAVSATKKYYSSYSYKRKLLWGYLAGKAINYLTPQEGESGQDVGNRIALDMLAFGIMSSVTNPAVSGKGYNPSVTTQESMSGIGFVSSAPKFATGSFSISNWNGYPAWGVKPAGPFRILEVTEYASARALANRTNAAIHKAAPYLKDFQIHEITRVKFGGSPTDPANKIFLSPTQHSEYTNFWNSFLRNMKK